LPIASEVCADRLRGQCQSSTRSALIVYEVSAGNSHLSLVGEVYDGAVIVICRSSTRSAPIVYEVSANRLRGQCQSSTIQSVRADMRCDICRFLQLYLKTLKTFNAEEELTKFGPFATLSNAMRHTINREQIRAYPLDLNRLRRLKASGAAGCAASAGSC
jgi:hypothetical protein